jgi:hypothetical protein
VARTSAHPVSLASSQQAHESSLQWRLGLLSSTAFRAGPALPSLRPAILRVVTALAAAPSQASLREAAGRSGRGVMQLLCGPIDGCGRGGSHSAVTLRPLGNSMPSVDPSVSRVSATLCFPPP